MHSSVLTTLSFDLILCELWQGRCWQPKFLSFLLHLDFQNFRIIAISKNRISKPAQLELHKFFRCTNISRIGAI